MNVIYWIFIVGFLTGSVVTVEFIHYMGKRLSRKKDVGVYCADEG